MNKKAYDAAVHLMWFNWFAKKVLTLVFSSSYTIYLCSNVIRSWSFSVNSNSLSELIRVCNRDHVSTSTLKGWNAFSSIQLVVPYLQIAHTCCYMKFLFMFFEVRNLDFIYLFAWSFSVGIPIQKLCWISYYGDFSCMLNSYPGFLFLI